MSKDPAKHRPRHLVPETILTIRPVQNPRMSKDDIARFRNSLKQNICVELLREGYHKSFSELFSLLKCWQDMKSEAGPKSVLWLQTPLEDQPDKLKTLKLYLRQCEEASRAGSWTTVYTNQQHLAEYFSDTADLWLRLYFWQRCVDSACRLNPDWEGLQIQASAKLATLYLDQSEPDMAGQYAEQCLQLLGAGIWGQSVFQAALDGWKVYDRLAETLLNDRDYEGAILLLDKAYSMATFCGDKLIEGKANYRLGLAYQSIGDQDTATDYLKVAMKIFSQLEDSDALGKTYKAMAQSVDSKAVEYLERYVDISRGSCRHSNLQDAYLSLGKLYHKRGQYKQSLNYLEQCFEMACRLGDQAAKQHAQIWVGIARAECLIRQ